MQSVEIKNQSLSLAANKIEHQTAKILIIAP